MAWFGRIVSRRGSPKLRALALGAFALATGFVAACGHQVTPEPPIAGGGNLAGKVSLRFATVGTLNFNTYEYAVILNTCGSGQPPYPNVFGTSFLNYSYGFFIGGAGNGASTVTLYQYYFNPTPALLKVQLDPSLIQFNPNSNGQGTEFSLIFSRSLLNNYFHISQPCPNVTQPPATPVPGSTATPTAGPTTAPTGGTTATPTANPNTQPTTVAQSTWILNFMTFNTALVPQDSLGPGGANDNSYQGIIVNTNAQSFQTINRLTPLSPPNDPSAQIAGGGVDNYP